MIGRRVVIAVKNLIGAMIKMAKHTAYICDICGKIILDYDEIVRLKAKSGKYIYHRSSRYDTKLLDICADCVKSFEKWMGERNENDEQTRVHRSSYGDLDH